MLVSLDLGGLRVTADRASFLAAHARDDQTFFQAPTPPPLTSDGFSTVLPPISIPPLDLASFSPTPTTPDAIGPTLSDFAPYARNIVWESIVSDPRRPNRVTLHARHDAGTLTLEADRDRLLAITIEHRPGTTIAMRFAELSPCDPASSALSIVGRSPVPTLDDLHPRSAMLRLGVVTPPLPLSTGPGEAWSVEDFMQTPAEFVPGPVCEHLVLIFTRADDPTPKGPGPLALKTDLARLGALLKQIRADSFAPPLSPAPPPPTDQPASPMQPHPVYKPLNFALVLVLDSPAPEDVLERIAPLSRSWGPNLLWTTSAPASIDLLLGQTPAGYVVLDAEGVLRAATPLPTIAAAEGIELDIRATLEKLASGLKIEPK